MNERLESVPFEILKSLEESENCSNLLGSTRDTLQRLKTEHKLILPESTYKVLKETLHLLLIIRGSRVTVEHNMKELLQDAYAVGQIEFIQHILTHSEIEI